MNKPLDAYVGPAGWPATRRSEPIVRTTGRVAQWLLVWGLLRFDLATAILLFAPLVIVPLGLALIDLGRPGTAAYQMFRWATLLRTPAAWLLVGVFLPVSYGAPVLAAPWLVFTLLTALSGVLRIIERGTSPAHAFCQDAGLIFLSIGGVWTFLLCLGHWPLGFSSTIVLLTCVHFHYAGFALPLLLSQVTRELPGRYARVTIVGTLVAIPMVAIGIAWSPEVEVVASGFLAAFCLLLAGGQLVLAIAAKKPSVLSLLASSALSLLAGMTLAAVYALGEYTGTAWIDIPRMIGLHGAANAFGFALLGLLGWNIRLAD